MKENTATQGNVSKDKLQKFIDKIELLEEQKNGIADDIKEIYKEAIFHGLDSSILKKIIRLRKLDRSKLEEEDYLTDLYRKTLGI